jgi:hypothetical protein
MTTHDHDGETCPTCRLTDKLVTTLVREGKKCGADAETATAALARTFCMLLGEVDRQDMPRLVVAFTDHLIEDLADAFGVDLDELLTMSEGRAVLGVSKLLH